MIPSISVSHGSPTLLLDETPAHVFLRELGKTIGEPSAIMTVSAHWETSQPTVTLSTRLKTIYDFYGFNDSQRLAFWGTSITKKPTLV